MIGIGISPALAALMGEEDVTPEKLVELLSKISQQSWHLNVLTGMQIIKNGANDWSVSAGNTEANQQPPCLEVNNHVAGANKSWQIFLDNNKDASMQALDVWPRCRYQFGAGCSAWSPNRTAGMRSGIQIGTPASPNDITYPFPVTPISPYARLGIKHDTDKIYFECAKGDGVGGVYSIELGDYPQLPDDRTSTPWLDLVWDPYNERILVLIDHVQVLEYTNKDYLPHFGADDELMVACPAAGGLYAESGSNAAASIVAEFYYPRRFIFHAATRGGGAQLWYPA